MKKRFLYSYLVLLLLLCTLLCACKSKEAASAVCKNEHTASEWTNLLDATEDTDGKRYKFCTVCGVTLEIESIPATLKTKDMLDESDNLLCFELLADGTYGVRATDAAKNEKKLTVPATYNEKAVTRLLAKAFADCKALTEIILPDTLCAIGDEAFLSCTALESICIPSSVHTVGSRAFAGCFSLCYYTDEYGYAKYLGNSDNPYLVLLEFQGSAASSYCVVNNRAQIICPNAFFGTDATCILLPRSICRIEINAFTQSGVQRLYYKGDAADLAQIEMSNGTLGTVTVYLYSDHRPTQADNYWHYIQDDPVPWN